VWTPESVTRNSLDIVAEGDAVDQLLRRGGTELTVDRRKSGMSLFSERTRRRWALDEEWAAAQAGHEEAPTRGSGAIPMVGEDRQGRGWRRRSDSQGLRSDREGPRSVAQLHQRHRYGSHGQGPQVRIAGTASGAPAVPTARRGRGRQRAVPPRNGNWTNAQLQAALTAHERGCSVSGATALYDIPRTSFHAHLAGIVLSHKRGVAPILTEVEEQ
jgi:hypothetical protein